MRACSLALAGLLSTAGCSCGPTSEPASWSVYRGRIDTVRALYPGFDPSLRARRAAGRMFADLPQGTHGARREQFQCDVPSDPKRGVLAELTAITVRANALRERCLMLASQPVDPARPARTDAVKEVRRIVDRVDRALSAGAAETGSEMAILAEVADQLDAAAAMFDRLTERTM